MAERRMFAKTIVLSDAFLDMPMSARCFYFTLGMFADDDGFVNNPKAIMRQCGASIDDMNVLIAKKFVILFEDGVIVIKHWRINNYLRSDRYVKTKYVDDKALLTIDENGAYTVEDADGIPPGIPKDGIPSIGKDRLVEDRIGKDRKEKTDTNVSVQKKKSSIESEFDELWKLYPKKQGRKKALQCYIKARKDGVERETIEQAIRDYTDFCKRTNRSFADGSTWFNQAKWEDDYSDTKQDDDNDLMSWLQEAREEGLI